MVRSVTHASELLRLRCGSMRRPFSLKLAGADDITFAFHRDDRLHIYRRATPRNPAEYTQWRVVDTAVVDYLVMNCGTLSSRTGLGCDEDGCSCVSWILSRWPNDAGAMPLWCCDPVSSNENDPIE